MASEFSVETSLVNYQPEKLDAKELRNGTHVPLSHGLWLYKRVKHNIQLIVKT